MERSGTLPNSASTGLDASVSSLNSAEHESSAASSAHPDTQQSKWTSATTSLTASPLASRETSPSRTSTRPSKTSRTSSAAAGARSRKNSTQDPSPPRTRSTATPTSHAATLRQPLSSASTPTLPPPSNAEPTLRAPVPQKPSVAVEYSKDSPRWPVSPRLKSPPPALNKPAAAQSQSSRKNDPEPPAINVQRATPSSHLQQPSEPPSQTTSDNEGDESVYLLPGTKTPARGPSGGSSTLETVQEVSQPNTPGPNLDVATEKLSEVAVQSEGAAKSDSALNKSSNTGQNGTHSESGSDSGSVKASTRRSSSVAPPPLLHSRQSSTALKFGGKGHTTGETSAKNIMVEEEEVNSIPRVSLGLAPAGQGGANGSLKTKPSSETIRPKKEKKRPSRKQTSVTSGTGEPPNLTVRPNTLRHRASTTSMSSASYRSPRKSYGQGSHAEEAISPRRHPPQPTRSPSITVQMANMLTGGPRIASSKADIFEAKVASAVEEANSSDSDETFVYDSNPPDTSDRPRRYHSRTPSATSMVSQVDRNGMRSIHSVLDNPPNPAVRKNMKFVNTYNSNGADSVAGDEDGRGTGGRSNAGSARGSARQHHHGRWGRNTGNNHLSLFDNESPFPNATRPKFVGNTSRQSSNPPSPRFANRPGVSNGKRQLLVSGNYDLDDTTTGADDERTPLIAGGARSSIRSNRSRRIAYNRDRDLESRAYRQMRPSFLNRFANCLVLTIMLLLVITGAIGFMFATSQPLTDIKLVKIGNILASEQELMMDITVRAHNPNVVVVTIDSADLEVFAKSPHSGTDSQWWRHPHDDELGTLEDPNSDRPSDPSDDKAPNMRIGNIVDFDNPLTFEGFFVQSGVSVSSGELRLVRPGNGTDGGSERWERIIADEFTLLIKGVLKYTLPLSQRVRSVPISGKTLVKPNSANDPTLRPNSTDFEIGIS